MPGKSERIKVEVKESSNQGNKTFTITLIAPVSEFHLTDLLYQRGVIHSLDVALKQAVKQATDNYIKSAETLISGLASNGNSKRKPRFKSTGNNNSAESVSVTSTSIR